MEMIDDVTFPKIHPKITQDVKIILPQISYGFIIIPEAQAAICM